MSIQLIGCLKESEGQVRFNQVLTGQVRTGKVKTDQVKTYQFLTDQIGTVQVGIGQPVTGLVGTIQIMITKYWSPVPTQRKIIKN